MSTPDREYLSAMSACADMLDWLGDRSIAGAWPDCPRGDWMLWWAARCPAFVQGGDLHHRIGLAACEIARTALVHVPAGEVQPLRAIETAERFWHGEASIDAARTAAVPAVARTGASRPVANPPMTAAAFAAANTAVRSAAFAAVAAEAAEAAATSAAALVAAAAWPTRAAAAATASAFAAAASAASAAAAAVEARVEYAEEAAAEAAWSVAEAAKSAVGTDADGTTARARARAQARAAWVAWVEAHRQYADIVRKHISAAEIAR